MFVRHQASIRSTAAQHYVKDDPIFDKYVEEEDDSKLNTRFKYLTDSKRVLTEIEPRKQRNEEVDLIVNLLATQEDHKEVCWRSEAQ